MKASECQVLSFLRKSNQFIVPIYQRTYSWTESECRQLWEDILRSGNDDNIASHFVGSVVYIEAGTSQVTWSPLLVIDGQQRLTTIMLLLEALAKHQGENEIVDGFSAKKIRNYYLLNTEETDNRHYKLLLTETDQKSFCSIIDNLPAPSTSSLRIRENFNFFNDRIKKLGENTKSLCKGLSKLIMVDIALKGGEDNPQLIFESMNSTGRELSQADLIRNFILMGLEVEPQRRLYNSYWRPMEIEFGQEAYSTHFDGFVRHYLTFKTGEIPNVSAVYDAFKIFWHNQLQSGKEIDSVVSDVHRFAKYYCAMALRKETDRELAAAFRDLRELKVDVAYPFLLRVYHDYVEHLLSKEELIQIVRLIESYVFRRAVCAIPTNSLNKTFAVLSREIDNDRYVPSIESYLMGLPSYRRFPNDEEFKQELARRDLYNFRSRSYWLRRLENYKRHELVIVDEYTIEHILPQNENLSREWKEELGDDWKRIQETWLHTIGNLTLTGYNSEYGDFPFPKKRDMEGGFRNSPLWLNKGLTEYRIWDGKSIKDRAERLIHRALEVWAIPNITDTDRSRNEVLPDRESSFSLEDHAHLASGKPMRTLFEALRREILALDPCITEDILKLYIAYKAETNFVDIVPQSKRLRLSLNMHFYELNDPKGIAKDVTELGRWGNGDVEIGISGDEEMPYVMGLIRQSLEKQLGNNNSDD